MIAGNLFEEYGKGLMKPDEGWDEFDDEIGRKKSVLEKMIHSLVQKLEAEDVQKEEAELN